MREMTITNGGSIFKTKTFKFPGGEIQVSIDKFNLRSVDPVIVETRLQDSESIMQLVIATEILNRLHQGTKVLKVPYFPYARQDRVMDSHEAFSLRAVASVINSLGYDSIETDDPHSDVLAALIPRLRARSQVEIIKKHKALDELLVSHIDCFVSPDAGASKKIQEIAKHYSKPVIQASKVRDTASGLILETKIEEFPSKYGNFLIIDDICDGGRTFIELAKALRFKGAKEIYLFVTHGIFSRGVGVFEGLIDAVYTTESFISHTISPHIKVIRS